MPGVQDALFHLQCSINHSFQYFHDCCETGRYVQIRVCIFYVNLTTSTDLEVRSCQTYPQIYQRELQMVSNMLMFQMGETYALTSGPPAFSVEILLYSSCPLVLIHEFTSTWLSVRHDDEQFVIHVSSFSDVVFLPVKLRASIRISRSSLTCFVKRDL